MVKCSLCGREARGSFCEGCGAPVGPSLSLPGASASAGDSRVSTPQVRDAGGAGSSHASQPSTGNRSHLFIGVAGGVAAVLVAGMGLALFFVTREHPSAAEPTTSASAAPAQGAAAATERSVLSGPRPRITASAQPTATVLGPWPPAGTTECSPGIAVNANTSCPFALNVASGYGVYRGGSMDIYSPTTEKRYEMWCLQMDDGMAECTGGDNAAVYIRQ